MKMKRWTAVLAVGMILVVCGVAQAAIQTYSDRTAWETECANRGLTVITDEFDSEPPGFPSVTLGGQTLTYARFGGGPVQVVEGGVTDFAGAGYGDLQADFDAGSGLLALGMDHYSDDTRLSVTNTDGETVQYQTSGTPASFVGIISDTPLDPANPGYGGIVEVYMDRDGSWMANDFLNLSVGVNAVPEPATMSLLAIGGLGVLIRRKKR